MGLEGSVLHIAAQATAFFHIICWPLCPATEAAACALLGRADQQMSKAAAFAGPQNFWRSAANASLTLD